MEKPNVYLFHEINDEIFNTIEKISKKDPNSILTFDDGLYSNYMYLDKLKQLPNKKIFFISFGIIRSVLSQSKKDFITCSDAHNQTDLNYYMNIEELREIENTENCYIGLHGYYHGKCLNFGDTGVPKRIDFPKIINNPSIKGIVKCKKHLKFEMESMFELANILFEKPIKYFAWPYNIESNFIKNILLSSQNYILSYTNLEFFGSKRINPIKTIPKENNAN